MRSPEAGPGPASVRVEVLGPLRLIVNDTPIEVPGPKRRAVLALLARTEGRVVPADQLVDALWPSDPPPSARASLHSHISRLRSHLGAGASRLEGERGGYRLVLEDDALDAARARSLLRRAREIARREPATAGHLLREAHGLWRGEVLADLAEVDSVVAWSVTLNELRREVDDLLITCAIDAGEMEEVMPLALDTVAADPLREPAVLLLMRALAATGRAPDALRAAYDYRHRLAEETGLDPSPALGELEREIATGAGPPRRGGIPKPATRLAGRDSEIATLHRLIEAERLVTLVGPGGVGKTRVAIEVARRSADASMLLLAPVTDPAAVPHALAEALDLQVVRGDVLDACVALLGAGPRLLVIDNCEHLLEAARGVVSTLLDRCPELTVLATSREVLGLGAESPCRIAPLPLPNVMRTVGIEGVPAVAVFLDRARRVQPRFAPTEDDLGFVADIVRRLDGMPLAIELAAGRLSSFALADLHARIDRALDLLGDAGATDDRHRSLRATIEWSYDLLPPHEQQLYRHLSVFPDGFDLATAEAVATGLEVPGDTATSLAHLVDASMIEAELAVPARYRMLETLRSFGVDRLVAVGEDGAATERLLSWAVGLAKWIDDTMSTERELLADAALRRELPNLRAAWRLGREGQRLDEAIDLVINLAEASGNRDVSELWGWAVELVADDAMATHARWAAVLGIASLNQWSRGNQPEAEHLARRGLGAAKDDESRHWCHSAMSLVCLSAGAYADCVTHAVEATELSTKPTDRLSIGAAAALYGGDAETARDLNARVGGAITNPGMRALYEYVEGEIDNATGRAEAAEAHYARAIELSQASGATFVAGIASVGLLTLRTDAGRIDEALRGYREVIDYFERSGFWTPLWTTLRNFAQLLDTLGDHEPALFIRVAAEHAPEASAMDDSTTQPSGNVDHDTAEQIRAEASSSTRVRVLEVAREAIDRHVNVTARAGK